MKTAAIQWQRHSPARCTTAIPKDWMILAAQSMMQNPSLLSVSGTFNSLFKVLCNFRSHYLFAIGLVSIFSFRRNLPPTLECTPKHSDSERRWHIDQLKWVCTGLSPSRAPLSNGLHLTQLTRTTFTTPQFGRRDYVRFELELFLLHSQLLKESQLVSFPPLIDMLKFSGCSC